MQLENIFRDAKKKRRPLLLDGAMGSLLESRKFAKKDLLWSTRANIISSPEVLKIHKAYIKAGADIITTNTFRTNPSTLEKSGISKKENYIRTAVDLAKEASENRNVLIAGSNPPAEDCYQRNRTLSKKKLELNHHYHITNLWNCGVHFILNETQSHLDEIEIIAKYCSVNQIPFVVSLYVLPDLTLLSGENFFKALEVLNDYSPLAISYNCIDSKTFSLVYPIICKSTLWGAYLIVFDSKKKNNSRITPSAIEYSEITKRYLPKNPCLVGSCCGSSPLFTKYLRKMIDANT
ncbi:MAG: homocysteine S-methyltransferase family protein [Ignavibacteriales bacterium]|nr:MAG: homocysteine S-methyltransferase family protein [Ignavibacteriales bacterium]